MLKPNLVQDPYFEKGAEYWRMIECVPVPNAYDQMNALQIGDIYYPPGDAYYIPTLGITSGQKVYTEFKLKLVDAAKPIWALLLAGCTSEQHPYYAISDPAQANGWLSLTEGVTASVIELSDGWKQFKFEHTPFGVASYANPTAYDHIRFYCPNAVVGWGYFIVTDVYVSHAPRSQVSAPLERLKNHPVLYDLVSRMLTLTSSRDSQPYPLVPVGQDVL